MFGGAIAGPTSAGSLLLVPTGINSEESAGAKGYHAPNFNSHGVSSENDQSSLNSNYRRGAGDDDGSFTMKRDPAKSLLNSRRSTKK